MTVSEALNRYSTDVINASLHDNINRICWRLYKNLNQKNIQVLMSLNVRYDWDNIKPGAEIKYFPQYVNELIQA